MIDPFVFDQIDGDEEAIDAAMERARKQRKARSLMMLAGTIHMMCGEDALYNSDDYSDDWDDEIYND